jgi:hypothetical protein
VRLYDRHPELTALLPLELYERGRRLAIRLAQGAWPIILLHGDLTPATSWTAAPSTGSWRSTSHLASATRRSTRSI